MDKVTRTEQDFRAALHASLHAIHTTDYTNLNAAYKTWHDMAVGSMQGMFKHVRRREQEGPPTGKRRFSRALPLLLAELARFDV
jgi:hypothetical protein